MRKSFYRQYCSTDPFSGKRLAERYGTVYVVQNPPAKPLSTREMDEVYGLPYCRTWHPSYDKEGGVPALSEVKFSLVSNRGCFGGCSFCALTFHLRPSPERRRNISRMKRIPFVCAIWGTYLSTTAATRAG